MADPAGDTPTKAEYVALRDRTRHETKSHDAQTPRLTVDRGHHARASPESDKEDRHGPTNPIRSPRIPGPGETGGTSSLPDEQAQADILLADASEIIRNRVRPYPETHDPAWWLAHERGLELVCCQMVRTAMEAQVSGGQTGVTQSTETTGPFSSTYSWAEPRRVSAVSRTTCLRNARIVRPTHVPSASTWHPEGSHLMERVDVWRGAAEVDADGNTGAGPENCGMWPR
ncbi:MAG: hypothetical protein ACLR5M_09020 [Bifidobacterium longum]